MFVLIIFVILSSVLSYSTRLNTHTRWRWILTSRWVTELWCYNYISFCSVFSCCSSTLAYIWLRALRSPVERLIMSAYLFPLSAFRPIIRSGSRRWSSGSAVTTSSPWSVMKGKSRGGGRFIAAHVCGVNANEALLMSVHKGQNDSGRTGVQHYGSEGQGG